MAIHSKNPGGLNSHHKHPESFYIHYIFHSEILKAISNGRSKVFPFLSFQDNRDPNSKSPQTLLPFSSTPLAITVLSYIFPNPYIISYLNCFLESWEWISPQKQRDLIPFFQKGTNGFPLVRLLPPQTHTFGHLFRY